MSERRASMGDKVYRGDVVKFIRNNISLDTFMKRTIKTADEACWDLCDKLNYVPAIEENPLIPLPSEHGDLIDRDALMVELMDSDLDHLQRDDWREVIQIVEDANVIIPAESEDE